MLKEKSEDRRLALPLLERVVRERTESTLAPSVTMTKLSEKPTTPSGRKKETYMVKRLLGHACDF
jgi:hypothetical protein